MKFLILPLLAAVNYLNIEDTNWPYGAEIIFNVTGQLDADQTIFKTQNVIPLMSWKYLSQMKCRYFDPDTLKCHLHNSTTFVSDYSVEPPKYETEPDPFTNNLPFEIKFNQTGIVNLVVPSAIYVDTLDKLRAIVNQFHTGIDLVGKIDGTYGQFENFTTGICYTIFNLKLVESTPQDDVIEDNNRNTHNEMWSPEMGVKIDKTRDLQNCRIYTPYFFEHTENMYQKPHLKLDVKSSESSIIADTSLFVSVTRSVVDVYRLRDPVRTVAMQVRDEIGIVFDSVVPAKEKYPEILHPMSVELITGK